VGLPASLLVKCSTWVIIILLFMVIVTKVFVVACKSNRY